MDLKPRTGTPITDAFRILIKDPEFQKSFVEFGNAFTAVQRKISESKEKDSE